MMSRRSMSDPETPVVASDSDTPQRVSSRAMIVETLKGWGTRVVKEELRRKIVIPEYLRRAVVDAMRTGDAYGAAAMVEMEGGGPGEDEAPEAPMVVFINARSGGRHGPVLKSRLQELIGEDQVFDLATLKPSDLVEYGLTCLEKLADHGDHCARATRERMRIMVAGGDGTVGWVLHSLGQLPEQNREPVPPVGIIPLGTGNDLSRSFGWGGSFSFAWKSAVKRCLNRAVTGPICRLDSWRVVVSMSAEETVDLPHSLSHMRDCTFSQDGYIFDMDLPEEVSCFGGDFYNYFSIGMDAQVTYGFHHLRDEKPYLAQGPITNKLIYTGYSCAQGWFFTSCMSDPSLRGLKNILRIHIKKYDCSEWEQIQVPSSVRAVVALNLHNYGSGRNPWGNLKPGYLMKRGFVEAQADDGLLEIFGLKQGWHASAVMVELVPAKHIAQASAIRLEIRGGQWNYAFMQMDGEPWKQPVRGDYSTFVEIKKVPYQSLLIRGE